MGAIEGKLAKMGLRLPPVHPCPSPNRIPCVQVGDILFLGGHSTAGRREMNWTTREICSQ